jgi:protein tyrosine/serine phosphatase
VLQAPLWIDLEGAANVRDVGALPLTAGGQVRANRLIRADNLQDLSPTDVRTLIDDHGVRAIADLRTAAEVVSEGPGPLQAAPGMRYLHASLFPDDGDLVTVRTDGDGPIVLPWHNRSREDRRSAARVYAGYLTDRPDSILATLRLIAHGNGAAIVHCAAGKDRTGVIVALALDSVGVARESIVEDYVRTAERTPLLLARLASSATYAGDQFLHDPNRHAPRASSMEQFLQLLDSEHGGTQDWLAGAGWTADDQRALRAKLVADC